MPTDDQPKPDSYYLQQLEASLANSRAQRQYAENLTVAQRAQVLSPSVSQATAGGSILGAIGSNGRFVLPSGGQPPLPQKVTAAGVVYPNQFTLYNASTADGTLRIGITLGMVNNGGSTVYASGVGPYPDVFTQEPNSPSLPGNYVFAVSASGFVWLQDTIDPTQNPPAITGMTIGVGDTVPMQEPGPVGYFVIGAWTVNGSVLTIGAGSISTGNGVGQQQLDFDGNQHYYSIAGASQI